MQGRRQCITVERVRGERTRETEGLKKRGEREEKEEERKDNRVCRKGREAAGVQGRRQCITVENVRDNSRRERERTTHWGPEEERRRVKREKKRREKAGGRTWLFVSLRLEAHVVLGDIDNDHGVQQQAGAAAALEHKRRRRGHGEDG